MAYYRVITVNLDHTDVIKRYWKKACEYIFSHSIEAKLAPTLQGSIKKIAKIHSNEVRVLAFDGGSCIDMHVNDPIRLKRLQSILEYELLLLNGKITRLKK